MEYRWAGARIVIRDIGALQALLGGLMSLPLLVSVAYGEHYSALSFLLSGAVSISAGVACYRMCRDAPEPSRRHAMMVAAAGWLACAAFGALPYVVAAYLTPADVARAFVPDGESYTSSLINFRNPLHAYFESMSGFTTTGLTMAVHEPSLGRGLLFYRSLTQWIGGAGVIVLALAIIPRPQVAGILELYKSESSGAKVRPGVLGTARSIWAIYTGLTALVTLYLVLATAVFVPEFTYLDNLYHSINHAMTGLATGGFSTLDDSISGFGSYPMELAHIPPMLLGAISIPLYYAFLRERSLRVFTRDPQFRSLCYFCLVGAPLLVFLLGNTPGVAGPLREGLFQFVSGFSGTGWQTSNIAVWPAPAILVLAWGGMVVSGSAGSTVGGVKLIRAYLISRAVVRQVKRVLLPDGAVVPFKVAERHLSDSEIQREVSAASVLCLLYVVVLAAAILAVSRILGPGYRLEDVVFECVSAQGTVGLSTGITDPGMPASVELIFIFQMWAGRLEIIPVVVLFTAILSRWRKE